MEHAPAETWGRGAACFLFAEDCVKSKAYRTIEEDDSRCRCPVRLLLVSVKYGNKVDFQ